MRRHLTFNCEGSTLAGTLDEGAAETGLLLVTGGNEIRAGAWGGQALLAARIAQDSFPVFRFDRRGVGDSEGMNGGFRSSGPDIAAALAAFRRECPQITRIVGMGNCDAASALMLAGGARLDGLLLTNPWTIDDEAAAQPPAAIRSHYRQRLADAGALKRLLSGQVSLGRLLRSLMDAVRPSPSQGSLVQEMAKGTGGFSGPVVFLLAGRDRTAQIFRSTWQKGDTRIRTCPDATHSFVEPEARDWLAGQVLEMLRG